MVAGLHTYTRDLTLPYRFGDSDLVPPSDSEVLELVQKHLLLTPDDPITELILEHVRYKPNVAITLTYGVRLQSGLQSIVVFKAHRGQKRTDPTASRTNSPRIAREAWPFLPRVELSDRLATLSAWPSDRVLRGLVRALEKKRTARLLDSVGGYAPFVMRLRASQWKVLRFKPERRAVLQVKAKLRGPEEARAEKNFALRVLAPVEAHRVHQARTWVQTHQPELPAPSVLGIDSQAGLLLETWLDGQPNARDQFAPAPAVAALLRQLHTTPRGSLPDVLAPTLPLRCFEFDANLKRSASRIPLPPLVSTTWIHGDLHPDQCLLGPRLQLLDWDALQPGIPEQDLASWITDQWVLTPHEPLAEVASPLLEAYGVGAWNPQILKALIAAGLVQRAAGLLRRLQAEAPQLADQYITLAHTVSKEPL